MSALTLSGRVVGRVLAWLRHARALARLSARAVPATPAACSPAARTAEPGIHQDGPGNPNPARGRNTLMTSAALAAPGPDPSPGPVTATAANVGPPARITTTSQ